MIINFVRRYDKLAAYAIGAVMTFASIYFTFRTAISDIQTTKNTVHDLELKNEKVMVFMERQVLVDQRQNEILQDLKEEMGYTWHVRKSGTKR